MESKVFKEADGGKVLKILVGHEPIYLASEDTNNPTVISWVELMFWSHGLHEHSLIIKTLLPCDDEKLKKYRENAEHHEKVFKEISEKTKKTDFDDMEGINKLLEETAKHTEMVAKDLNEMIEKQSDGKIRTLMYTSFMEHLVQEADYFIKRKDELVDQNPSFEVNEIKDFWADIMSDHSVFVGNMLDPYEVEMADEALEMGSKFLTYEEEIESDPEQMLSDLDEFINLKKELYDGIESAEISSIIIPELAEHMLKEAIMFRDMLSRAISLGTV